MASPTFPKKVPATLQAKPVTYAPRDLEVKSYLPEIFRGVGVSMKHFFENTREMLRGKRPDPVLDRFDDGITTISYPEQKRPYPDRFRGIHRLTTRADGSVRCVACLCCSTACPAQCIHIEAGEYAPGDPRRGYERFPVKFVIDELRCIFCGYCVEACPCDAIRMDTGMHAVPYDSRDQFIYDRDLLLSFAGRDGHFETQNPRHEPGDPTHPGVSREHESH
ncbi:MAG: NADH-quinone oxidoreductase subunit I [Myxococcales bacterium]|nr:NADH-quinone oxidoreductase subunit I [Myxococcales bacterium]